ncbi:MAG: DUF3817 domain-containing protein [Sphingobacteriaceae bacterium]
MKFNFSNTPLGRFRLVGITEGISYLFLLFIAMPFKYLIGVPEVVKYTGWAHGILFVAYMLTLAQVMFSNKWPLWRTFVAFLASLVPFGTFILDKCLYKEEKLMLKRSTAKSAVNANVLA